VLPEVQQLLEDLVDAYLGWGIVRAQQTVAGRVRKVLGVNLEKKAGLMGLAGRYSTEN
jgi:hypothetical protein